jgi:hypothetical protein
MSRGWSISISGYIFAIGSTVIWSGNFMAFRELASYQKQRRIQALPLQAREKIEATALPDPR